MNWIANVTSVNSDPNDPGMIIVAVDYTDSHQTISETYSYNSINLTDSAQIDNQIQARLSALTGFAGILDEIKAKVGQAVSLTQDSSQIDKSLNEPVKLNVSKVS